MVVDFEGQTYQLDIDEIDVAQAMLIKVKTGYNLLQWQDALEQADVEAVKALYWLMMEQNGRRENYDTLNFKVIKFAKAVTVAQKTEVAAAENPTGESQNAG